MLGWPQLEKNGLLVNGEKLEKYRFLGGNVQFTALNCLQLPQSQT